MGPKKDPKKQVVEPPQQEQPPPIPPHELQGYGKFQYLDGAVYQGSWRLCDGIKMKHGQGILKTAGQSQGIGGQKYEGSWEQDKMNGYGVYNYANGAVYKGEWKNNKHNGRGQYEFPNGTCYDGDWQNHLMHGAGSYIDGHGRKWSGQFRNGQFESKLQKQLAAERQLIVIKAKVIKQIQTVISNMLQALAKSDKKTLKQNFSPFFASGEVIKQLLKDPYAKFDEKPQDKWTQLLSSLKQGKINPLSTAQEAKVLSSDRILKAQLEGPGQIVEIVSNKNEKQIKGVFVNIEGAVWVLILIAE